MLTDKELKSYAIQSGNSLKDTKKIYDKATKEAKSLGKEKDELYVIEILEDMLGLDEDTITQKLLNKFIESEYTDFDVFIEALTTSDISTDTRPEMHIEGPVVTPEIDTTEENEKEVEDSEGLIERNLDGTGPEGKGPGTGRGMGLCSKEDIEAQIEEDLLKFKKDTDIVLDTDEVEEPNKELLYGNEDDKI